LFTIEGADDVRVTVRFGFLCQKGKFCCSVTEYYEYYILHNDAIPNQTKYSAELFVRPVSKETLSFLFFVLLALNRGSARFCTEFSFNCEPKFLEF